MKLIGGRSGFKTARDLIFCAVGLSACVYHLVTAAGHIQVEVLVFFGGLAGSPYVLSKDEKRGSE